MRRSLQIAIGAAALAFAMLGAALAIARPSSLAPVLAVAAIAWAWVLLPWYRRHADMSPADHQRGMYAALRAWAVTDIAVLLAFA
jgi:hypothetical protein